MKIVVLGTRGIPNILGGVETHCEELYPRLVKSGLDIEIITRSPYVKDKSIKNYKGVKLKHLYAPKLKSFEAIIHTLVGLLYARLKSPDIVHIHSIGPSILVPIARLMGLKVVFTNHGPDYNRQKWNKAAKFVLELGEKNGAKYSNKVIVISEVINSILQKKYKRTDANLIYNGVNIPKISDNISLLKEIGIEKGKYILTVGRFVEEKGFTDLIKAFTALKPNGIKLVIAGDADHETEYSKKLKNMAMKNGIILTGFVKGEKLNQLFSNNCLFVLPSYHEGLPISLLEAMSYNNKVLVSDIEPHKELGLTDDCYFKTGEIVDLKAKLDDKIFRKSDNDYQELIKLKYNWDNISKQVINVYKSLFA